MDKYKKGNPLSRPELKALSPIWDLCMLENNLTQINFKNTWHMVGKHSSLLDLYYCTAPEVINGVTNVTNILSEHDGIKLNIHTKEKHIKAQCIVKQIYTHLNYNNLMTLLDENMNTLFKSIF